MPQPGAEPVVDWSHDWDHHDEAWVTDPYRVWNQMRGECPMGRTARYNDGTWLPLTYDQLHAIAHDTESFSNKHYGITAGGTDYNRSHMPPINSDPPDHHAIRRLILPFFAPRAIESWRGAIEQHCVELAESIAGRGEGDAAIDYAQHIPVFAIAAILGIPHEQGDQFLKEAGQRLSTCFREGDTVHETGPGDAIWLPDGVEVIYEADEKATLAYAIYPIDWRKQAGLD